MAFLDIGNRFFPRFYAVVEIISMINARSTRGEGNSLIVEGLFENLPADQESIDVVRSRAQSNPLYRDLLFTDDYQVAMDQTEIVFS